MDEVRPDEKPQKESPFDRANVISKVFFCWLLPYFVKGYRRELTEDDMYQHPHKHESAMLGDKLEAAWLQQVRNNQNPSFIKAICNVFLPEIAILWTIIFMMESARFSQPLMISKLLRFYDENSVDKSRTYMYAGLILLISFLNMLHHTVLIYLVQIGMKMRIACCSLVYRKSLKLNKSSLAETTIGQMVNLLSNDVARFDQAIPLMSHLIVGPLETIVVMILLYNSVGYTGLIGAVFLLLVTPIQAFIGKKASELRLKTAVRTDERIRLMNEIICGIQVIKMYAWEKSFAQLVEVARMKEMKYIRLTSILRAILMSCSLILNRVAVFSCILTFVLTGNSLNSAYVFTIASFYRLLGTITMFFPQAISLVSEMLTSIARIKTFLLYDELDSSSIDVRGILNKSLRKDGHISTLHKTTHRGIWLKGVSAKWLTSAPGNNLKDVTIDVCTGELVAIVGAVGSGKTTLLNLILGELKPESGKVTVTGTMSYASQEPWLFGGSIRQNILFGQTYNQDKYCEVIRVCALDRDFTLLPHGDRTLVGERGVMLSGGQRARINLARAVYKEADIYLLDDPLSAVDTHVGKQLFEECVSGYLKGKCVILVTHQLQYLKDLNIIYKLENGKVDISGSYHAITSLDTNFSKILLSHGGEDKIKRKSLKVVEKDEKKDNGKDEEIQVLQREEKGQGSVTWHVYESYMRSGGSICKVLFLGLAFVTSQALDSGAEYFVSTWVNIRQWLSENNQFNSTNEVEANGSLTATVPSSHGSFYENWSLTPIFTNDQTVIYYSSLVTMIIVVTFCRSLTFYRWSLTVSTKLHNKMFDNIVNSPMRFFNANPSGRILNRFSRDIGTLDESLPMTLLDTLQIGLTVLAISLVIGSLSIWILVPTIVIVILFYFFRVVFLETSRDVKRIESITRSPVYTHLTATLQGLTTIRAFKAQNILKKEFDKYQNVNTAASFMYVGVTRTFGFWLDLHCVIYFAMVLVAMLFVKGETFGGNMGLALTQAMGLTGMFQFGMRQWSEMENQMTSVERVQEYVDLVPEKGGEITELPESWPEKGHIKFNNVSLRYRPDDPFVLRNISVTIKDRENVGIVGRTGAGKSSLVQALFRLATIEGSIFIDDMDTETVALKELRSKISIIPQEPVLFSGSIRTNLDPFNDYDDEHLWNALDEVELKTVISNLRSGLDSKMSESGSNFSVGQRQLICLARAILRNNKILVLDEATANVDSQTDELIQKTIRKKFAHCTVLTIAHRLHTIMDSDKVLVLDAGQKVEFNHPHLLLQNKDGVFYSLVMQTGTAAENLMTIAEKAYQTQEVTRL